MPRRAFRRRTPRRCTPGLADAHPGAAHGVPLRMGVSRLLGAALAGVLAAVLVSCGSSGAGLIPAQDAGPLLRDFQAVERAAREANGSCSATEAALRRTDSDFQRLPGSVDAGLRARLQEGVSKLHELALEACAQPVSATAATGESTSAKKTAAPPPATTPSPTTTPGTTETAPTATTPGATSPNATQTSGAEGGTAPGVGDNEGQAGEDGASGGQGSAGGGSGQGGAGGGSGEGAKNGAGPSGGTGSGGAGAGANPEGGSQGR